MACTAIEVNYKEVVNMSQHPEERSKKTNGKSKSSDSEAGENGKRSAGKIEKKGGKSTSGRK